MSIPSRRRIPRCFAVWRDSPRAESHRLIPCRSTGTPSIGEFLLTDSSPTALAARPTSAAGNAPTPNPSENLLLLVIIAGTYAPAHCDRAARTRLVGLEVLPTPSQSAAASEPPIPHGGVLPLPSFLHHGS